MCQTGRSQRAGARSPLGHFAAPNTTSLEVAERSVVRQFTSTEVSTQRSTFRMRLDDVPIAE